MLKVFLKKMAPHLIAVGVFLVLSITYFSPYFNGYSLKAHDVVTSKGMQKEVNDYRLLNDEEALWTNSMFGGMPAYNISLSNKYDLLPYIDRAMKLGLPVPVGILFMCMLGFYILTLSLKVNPYLGIVGAIGFGFSTITILYLGAGHISKGMANSYMAPAVAGLILIFRRKMLVGGLVFCYFMAMNIYSTHIQITYYLAFICGAIALSEVIRLIMAKDYKYALKSIGVVSVVALISLIPKSTRLIVTMDYAKHTTRGTTELTIKPEGSEKTKPQSGLDKNYILEYNYGPGELLSIIAPSAKGEKNDYIGNDEKAMENVDSRYAKQIAQMSHYWGGQRISGGAFYFGVVMLVFALFGFLFLKDSLKWPLLVLSILALLLARNSPDGLNGFFIDSFPLYNKFRDSKMILTIIQLVIPVMGVLFLDRFLKKEGISGNKKMWLIASGAFVVIGLVLFASPSISGSFVTADEVQQLDTALDGAKTPDEEAYISGIKSELISARQTIYKSDMGRALFLIILACGLVLGAVYVKTKQIVIIGVAGLLVSFDNIGVCKRYINSEDLDEGNRSWEDESKGALAFRTSTADQFILDSETPSIPQFDSKVSNLKDKMDGLAEYDLISDNEKRELAEYGILNLNSDYRVLSFQNPFNESNTSYYHKSLGGYHGAKLKRYQEIIEFYLSKEMNTINQEISALKNEKLRMYSTQMPISQEQAQSVFDTIQINEIGLSENVPVINMLNTRYIIMNPQLKPVKNLNANGNAWFVENVIETTSADDEMLALAKLDSKRDVIVNQKNLSENQVKINKQYKSDSTDQIKMTKYDVKTLSYKSNSKRERPVVFSEIYYPDGWNFYIDNKLSKTFRANYLLRGAMVPAGEHELVWKFEPTTITKEPVVSFIGSLLIVLFGIFVFVKSFLEFKKKEVDAAAVSQ